MLSHSRSPQSPQMSPQFIREDEGLVTWDLSLESPQCPTIRRKPPISQVLFSEPGDLQLPKEEATSVL